MVDQIIELGIALLLFPLIIWLPGMILGYSADLLGFRARSPLIRITLALLFSMAACPAITYLLVRVAGFKAAWSLFAIVWSCAGVMLWHSHNDAVVMCRELLLNSWDAIVLGVGWCLLGAVCEIDFITSAGVLRSVITMDAIAHVAFTNSLTLTGIPPTNPFFHPGSSIPLFYYYFWYLICSLVDQLGGSMVTARGAVQAGTIYVGFAVAGLVIICFEFLGRFLYPGFGRISKRVGIFLLSVTGLDLLPWIFLQVMKSAFNRGSGPGVSVEHWNEQVTAWLGAIFMSPHHPAALVMGFTGLLLLLDVLNRPPRIRWLVSMGLASLALASAAGTSLYVTSALALGMGFWAVFASYKRWWCTVLHIVATGGAALLLYLPFAAELRAASRAKTLPLAFTIRAFAPLDYWLPSVAPFLKGSRLIYFLRFTFLPLNYFMELGFFLIAGACYWRWRRTLRHPLTAPEIAVCSMATSSVLICTFLRSTFRWNDLGWRAFLVAQFALLLWAAPAAQNVLVGRRTSTIISTRWRRILIFTMVLGTVGTVWELVGYRIHSLGASGPVTTGVRDAYLWVNRNTPRHAIVLLNPDVDLDYFDSLYGHRLVVATGRTYVDHFAVDAALAGRVVGETMSVFACDRQVNHVRALCTRYGATIVVVTAMDPIWNDHTSWVWKSRPSFANSHARVFRSQDMDDPVGKSSQP